MSAAVCSHWQLCCSFSFSKKKSCQRKQTTRFTRIQPSGTRLLVFYLCDKSSKGIRLNLIFHSLTVIFFERPQKSSHPLSSFILIFVSYFFFFSYAYSSLWGSRILSRRCSICRNGNASQIHSNSNAGTSRIANRPDVRSPSTANYRIVHTSISTLRRFVSTFPMYQEQMTWSS